MDDTLGAGCRGRLGRLPLALVILATILLVAGNIGYWVRGTLLNSDEFTDKVDEVLRSPEASERIGEVMAEQALSSGEIQNRLAAALPTNADVLPVLLQDQLYEVLARSFTRFLMLDATQNGIETAIRELHDLVVSALEGREGSVAVEGGALVLHLDNAVSGFLVRLGTSPPDALTERDVGRVVLVEDATALDAASRLVRGIDQAVPILLAGSFLGFAASVGLSSNKARAASAVGYGLVAAGVCSLIVWRLGKWGSGAFLDEAPVARMLIESLSSNLRLQSIVLAVVGAGIIIVADERTRGWLARQARGARSRIDSFGAARVALAGAAGVIVLLLIS